MKNEKQKLKTKMKINNKKDKNYRFQIIFLTPFIIFSFLIPSTWIYMGELNMPFSGRVLRFAEFFIQ